MTINTELIVLHTTKFGEDSVVLHTISREYGRRSFLIRKAGKRMSLFLPLNILEAEIVESSKSRLFTARSLSPHRNLIGIRNSIYKNAISMFISEVLYRVVKDEVNEPGLYEWCEKVILLLDAMQNDFSNYHIRFLLELSIVLGFSPNCSRLQPFAGEQYMELISRFLESSFEESMLIPMSGAVRNELAEILLRYIEHHIESAVNIRSLKVLREFFQ